MVKVTKDGVSFIVNEKDVPEYVAKGYTAEEKKKSKKAKK